VSLWFKLFHCRVCYLDKEYTGIGLCWSIVVLEMLVLSEEILIYSPRSIWFGVGSGNYQSGSKYGVVKRIDNQAEMESGNRG
jgi:hypothetical protein